MYAIAQLLGGAALILVLGAGLWHGALNPRHRSRTVDEFARRAGLALTPELAAEVGRRLCWRARCDLAGRVVGMIAFVALNGPGGIVVGALGGMAVGRCAAQVIEASRSVRRGSRVTHLLAPRLTDYVRPLSVVCVHVVGLLPVPLAAVWFVVSRRTDLPLEDYYPVHDGTVPATVAVTLAVALGAELGAQLTLRLRRVAGTAGELALDDALRVTTLRDLATLPLLVGCFSCVILGTALNHLPLGALDWLGSPLPAAVAVGSALVALGGEQVAPRRWRRRLYPEPATR